MTRGVAWRLDPPPPPPASDRRVLVIAVVTSAATTLATALATWAVDELRARYGTTKPEANRDLKPESSS